MATEPRLTFGGTLDKVLIGSVGLILFWVGTTIRSLDSSVNQLKEIVATIRAEQKSEIEHRARIQKQLDDLGAAFYEHQLEDSRRFNARTKK